MSTNAVLLIMAGAGLIFMSDNILQVLHGGTDENYQLLMQILGALYFGFGMLNWMTREGLIGGIYNRPVAIANFSHYFIAAMALLKGVTAPGPVSTLLWIATGVYLIFWVLFGLILFTHPRSG